MARYYATVDALGRATAFYDDQIHGARLKEVPDPGFDPQSDWPTDPEGNQDTDFTPPTIQIQNPDCLIPPEAFEVDAAVYRDWRANSGTLVWDGATQGLTTRILSLSEEQEAALAGINAERRSRCYPGRVTVTLTGLADLPVDLRGSDDRQNIAGIGMQAIRVLLQGSTQSFQFRDADNVQHSLSEAQASELATAVEAYISAVLQAAWTHKNQIASYGDLSTLSAHDANAGWPTA